MTRRGAGFRAPWVGHARSPQGDQRHAHDVIVYDIVLELGEHRMCGCTFELLELEGQVYLRYGRRWLTMLSTETRHVRRMLQVVVDLERWAILGEPQQRGSGHGK